MDSIGLWDTIRYYIRRKGVAFMLAFTFMVSTLYGTEIWAYEQAWILICFLVRRAELLLKSVNEKFLTVFS